MSKLKDKVVLVTGASKGIGRGIALEMASQGAQVVVNYASSKEEAEEVVNLIKGNGGKAVAIQANVSKSAEVAQLFEQVEEKLGTIDVLVNNAGVYQFAPLEAITEEEYRREFDINVLGPILTIQQAVNHFSDKGGSIINVSSVVVDRPMPMSAVYTATKASLNSITQVLSKELGPKNIRVNSIAPGLVATEGTHEIGVIGSEQEQMMIANTPLGRTGMPEDISKVAVFLASDESAWVSGQNIAAAGGF